MSMSEINNGYYLLPVTEPDNEENEDGLGDDGTTEKLLDEEYMSNTEDGIPSQDKNWLVGKILAVWERYKPLLEHDNSRVGYMLSMDTKTYAHEKVSFLYIYVNYHFIFLQFIIIKII